MFRASHASITLCEMRADAAGKPSCMATSAWYNASRPRCVAIPNALPAAAADHVITVGRSVLTAIADSMAIAAPTGIVCVRLWSGASEALSTFKTGSISISTFAKVKVVRLKYRGAAVFAARPSPM